MFKPLTLMAALAAGSAQAACPALDSRDWSADLVQNPYGTYALVLRGVIDLPTPGYRTAWRQGPMDMALPPGWRLQLEITPPGGIVPQVITPVHVEAHFDTPIDRFRVIYVVCDGEALAELKDIALAP